MKKTITLLCRWLEWPFFFLLFVACGKDGGYTVILPQEGSLEIKVTCEDVFLPDGNVQAGLYVFDSDHTYVYGDVSSHVLLSSGHQRTFTLPVGNYTVVAWCMEGSGWAAGNLTPDVTKLHEARMVLMTDSVMKDGHAITSLSGNLYHGISKPLSVQGGSTLRESVSLMRLTHDIHLRIRWKDADGAFCTHPEHKDRVKPFIRLMNGEYGFDGHLLSERSLTYFPVDLPGGVETPVEDVSVHADYRVGRLMLEDSAAKIVLSEPMPDGTLTPFYECSLVELIRLTGQYNTQAQLDREGAFHIDIDLRCMDTEHTTPQPGPENWTVVGITINGWVVNHIETGI